MPDFLVRRRWIAPLVATVSAALLLAGFTYTAMTGTRDAIISAAVEHLVIGGSFTAMGLLLAWRLPRNPIGWLFTVGGVAWGLGALSSWPQHLYAIGERDLSVGQRLLLVDTWPLGIVPCIQLPLLFLPDGRLRSPRWRVVAWAAVMAMVATTIPLAVAPGDIENYPGIRNPLGLEGARPVLVPVVVIGAITLFLCAAASMVGLVLRYRGSHGVTRQQLRWVALGAVIVVLGLCIGPFVNGLPGEFVGLVFAAVPITIAVAVLRHRLYDLGRIISRTVTYAALTASLAGIYLGIVALGATLSGGSGPSVAVATLATAALFRPLRSRLQAIVDRRFNRARYDAAATADAFSARLRGQLAVEAVRSDLLATVTRVVEPASASLWTPAGQP